MVESLLRGGLYLGTRRREERKQTLTPGKKCVGGDQPRRWSLNTMIEGRLMLCNFFEIPEQDPGGLPEGGGPCRMNRSCAGGKKRPVLLLRMIMVADQRASI